MPFGCSASLRSLSHFLQFLLIPHGSYCVLHATLFISSFVPLHYTTFAARLFAARHGTLSNTQSKAQVMHMPFRKPTLHYSLGSIPLHYVLHSLQSHSVHPLPIIWRALLPATATGLSWFLSMHTKLDENKNTRQTLASHCCCLSPLHGFLVSTVAGARSQFRSYLSPLAYGGTPLGYSVDKCATQLRFFLAAGAFTFLANAQGIHFNLNAAQTNFQLLRLY